MLSFLTLGFCSNTTAVKYDGSSICTWTFPFLLNLVVLLSIHSCHVCSLTMSSGPSQECLKGMSSGTILLSIISMSSLTSGSQFSLMASDADVCSSWMCISPTVN